MSDFTYQGTCHCGQAHYQVTLPAPLSGYVPRACDCDFCVTRHIAYLSDPGGAATITSRKPLIEQKQGSEQARFLTCPDCQDVLAATCPIDGTLKGAVNASLLRDKTELNAAEAASPKRLSAENKRARWADIWLNLSIQTET